MPPLIQLHNVEKTYSQGTIQVQALKTINLGIDRGEYVAIMGTSGSGKSTMMNILGCLDKVSTGDYILNGINVNVLNDVELAAIRNSQIGFVFQMFNLLTQYNAIENVALPLIYAGIEAKERREKAAHYLEMVGLKDRMHHKPNELSGGQQQRMAIARALVNEPSIILADEPTGNLDTKTTREIMKLFQDINDKGNTVVFITHEDDVAEYSHRIIKLKDGEVMSDERNTDIKTIQAQ